MRLGALLSLTVLALSLLVAKTEAQAEPPSVLLVATASADAERLALARRVGEACVFGAAAGAAGAMLAGAPVAVSGLGVPSVVGVSLGAAALGCTVGVVGATAATGFGMLWEKRLEPRLVPEAGAVPDAQSDPHVSWRVSWPSGISPARGD